MKTEVDQRTEIPPQLAMFPDARFILISKNDPTKKKPKEKNFQLDNNYDAKHPKLLGHIRGGGNYGIVTGFGGLHCLDADNYERLVELGVIAKIPKTFTVKTGRTSSEGRHYWLKIVGLQKRITFYDPELTDPDHPDQALHLGEILSKGNYAIGPGSVHKSGKRYDVIDNSQVAEIPYEQLMDILKPLKLRKADDRPKQSKYNCIRANSHEEVDLSMVGWPTGDVKKYEGRNGTEYKGSHPYHGSTHGENFSINPSKGIWHCFRCESGGGWRELFAVREGIIRCEDAGRDCLSRAQYREVMQRAEELGLFQDRVVDAPIAEIYLEREEVDQIPEAIPSGDMIALIAPPRTGKTHSVVRWLADNIDGNYLTHTHANVEHAVKIARELNLRGGVWVVGMNQLGACRQNHTPRQCEHCPMQVNKKNFMENESRAANLLHEVGILTVNEVPADMCPYFTLKQAEKFARYCFTVVNNINRIQARSLTIIDEEPALSHFYSGSIEVAAIKMKVGEISTKNYLARSKGLQHDLDQILNHGKKPNLLDYAKKLQEISQIIDEGIDNGKSAASIADTIEAALKSFNPKHREVRDRGENAEDGELSLEKCIRCLGHIYKDNPVHVMPKKGGSYSIYILGDERHTSYGMDWINKTGKVIVIGATKAKLFVKEFNGREIVVPKFRYDERFLLIGVEKTLEDTGTNRGRGLAQKKMVIDTAKVLWKSSEASERMPFLVLTGSKKEQARVASMLAGATEARDERESAMESEFVSGKPVIIFQNSVISRGLDVDQYNLMFVYGCNFAQPFWSVADPGIAAAIISDETTNSVLRISSTLRSDAKTLKVVVMRKDDLRKVKFISDDRDVSIDSIELGTILKKMRVTGVVKRNGRKDITVVEKGIDSDTGKQYITRLLDEISESKNVFDDEIVRAIECKIKRLLSAARRRRVKSMTSHQIKSELSQTCKPILINRALQNLSYSKKLVQKKAGKGSRWSLPENKRQNK